MHPLLMAKNISLGYREPAGVTRLLNGFSFSTDVGSSVAIFGASGSGKSGLLRVLAGVDRP